MDLVTFLAARLDEYEAAAKAFSVPEWMICENGDFDFTIASVHTELPQEVIADTWREDAAAWISRHDPARVLREVEAGRALLERYAAADRAILLVMGRTEQPCVLQVRDAWYAALRIRAAVYSDHPDYDEAWRT